MANVDRKPIVIGRDRFFFGKKPPILSKSSLKLISSICSSFFDWLHICYLWWTCFSTYSRHIHGYKLCSLFPLTCSFIRMRQTSYRGFSRKTKRSKPDPLISRSLYDVLSLNNCRFGDFFDRIYSIELEIKNTTDTYRSASYLDIPLEIDSEGRLRTKLYDKRDDFNFLIVRGLLLTRKLLNQRFLLVKLKSSLRKIYGRDHDLVDRYGIFVSQMTTNMFHLS
jgi:hypothetical protein